MRTIGKSRLFKFNLLLIIAILTVVPATRTHARNSSVTQGARESEHEFAGDASSHQAPLRLASASEKRFEDFWDDEKEGKKSSSYLNVVLGTDNLYVKCGVFVALVILLYLISWLIFRFLIMKNKAPQRIFVFCFLGFLIAAFAAAFVCFSEYAMIQAYDPDVAYLAQLNWVVLGICLLIWTVCSLLLTYLMRGKS